MGIDENGVASTQRFVTTPSTEIVYGAAARVWRLWSRSLISKNETIDRLLDSGVSEEDAQAIFTDTERILAKY